MNHEELIGFHNQYVMQTYAGTTGLMLVKGEGSHVWDYKGKEYLDFTAGISVCNLGHCHPEVTKAINEQASRLVHVSNIFMNEYQPLLAKKLISNGFDGVVFFGNSGAEANEGLIKFARKWGSDKDKYEIIAMENSFHGRTLATLAATGRSKYRKGFHPDMPGFKFVPFNDIDAIKNAIGPNTAAVMLEPIQGEGGIIPADPAYLTELRALCDEKNVLLMFDEVQCGIGRTGYFYAWQGYGIEPDALSMAKALGNGFPIGAFVVKRKYAEVLAPGTHGSTFGGTPLACAAACAVIDAIHNEKILENCQTQGHYMKKKLAELQGRFGSVVKDIRVRGLMIGIVLDRNASELLPDLMENGLLALSAGENVLRLLPPLTVTEKEIDQALSIIEETIARKISS
ncbi:MAG: acetylornithine aminotransferase [Lentisphaerae bacterium GWF2_45_14]|nr:MAG: acetylornithine aminotransferase [Lentisphaerae bacterium GWF2_45_14]